MRTVVQCWPSIHVYRSVRPQLRIANFGEDCVEAYSAEEKFDSSSNEVVKSIRIPINLDVKIDSILTQDSILADESWPYGKFDTEELKRMLNGIAEENLPIGSGV